MRWLYVPNENSEGDQVGPRLAFEQFHREGVFSAYGAYSYLVRGKAAASHRDAMREFFDTARSFAPDVIFIQHPSNGYPLARAWLQQLKAIPSKPKLVLHEADAYGRIVKRMDATLRAVLAESDISFLVGTGYLAELARTAGARRVRYTPHSYDRKRFGTAWTPTLTRKFDAVMIANLPCLKRIPGLYMPGGRNRKLTAKLLHDHLGDRFVLYGGGQGWNGKRYGNGKLAFDRQSDAIRDAWVSVNWGLFDDIPMYFSDRLPISLSCGVPHITNHQPGYESLFPNVPGLFTVKSPPEILDVTRYLLSLSPERRNELGRQAADFARRHLEATVVYRDIVSVVREQLFAGTPLGAD